MYSHRFFTAVRLCIRAWHILLTEGPASLAHKVSKYLRGSRRALSPVDWDAQYKRWLSTAGEAQEHFYYDSDNGPSFSLVLLARDPQLCQATLASVRGQIYPKWEVVAVPVTRTARPHGVERGQLLWLDGFSEVGAGLAAALKQASGDYIAIIEDGDRLAPDALARVAALLASHPETDIVYTDEDVLTEQGRGHPSFKPDWSPDTLLSLPYVGRLLCLRRDLCLAVLAQPLVRGAEEYDLILRTSEKANKIEHIPMVLYHRWHTNAWGGRKRSHAEKQAIKAALARRGWEADVQEAPASIGWRIRYKVYDQPEVMIVIPSAVDRFLESCIRSLAEKTSYPNWYVVVIDNTRAGALRERVESLRNLVRIEYRRYDKPFNFSDICNLAVEATTAPYVCLLNDDVEVITPDWLEAMLGEAQKPGVGAVGAKLLYKDGRIQHAGIAMGIFGICGHPYKFWPGNSEGYMGGLQVVRNTAGVTGACMLVPRSVWLDVGGMDTSLAVAYNDVDFCLRLLEKGYRVVFTPYAVLYHLESATKVSHAVDPKERAIIEQRWRRYIEHDPYYPPAFTRASEDYSLAL